MRFIITITAKQQSTQEIITQKHLIEVQVEEAIMQVIPKILAATGQEGITITDDGRLFKLIPASDLEDLQGTYSDIVLPDGPRILES